MAIMICGKKGAYLVNLSKLEMETLTAAIGYLTQDVQFARFAKHHYGTYVLGDLHHHMLGLVNVMAQQQQAGEDPFMRDLKTAYKDSLGKEITANGEAYHQYVEKGATKEQIEKAKALGEKLAKGLIRPDGTEVKLRTKAEEAAEEAAKKVVKKEEPGIPFEERWESPEDDWGGEDE